MQLVTCNTFSFRCALLLLDQSREKSKKDPGDSFRVLVQRAASAASKLANSMPESASANKPMDDDLVPLKCCLMSVSLPWDYIAHQSLFTSFSCTSFCHFVMPLWRHKRLYFI